MEPLDALIIINELNDPQFSDARTGSLLDAASLNEFPNFFYDVLSDGFVVALDVLRVINFLNEEDAMAEGEAVVDVVSPRGDAEGLIRAPSFRSIRPTLVIADAAPEVYRPASAAETPYIVPAAIRRAADDRIESELFADLAWLNE